MNSSMHRITVRLLFVLLLVVTIAAATQLAYAQTTYDEISVDVYSNTPEIGGSYSFNYILEGGTELGWELESDNSSKMFDLIITNDLDNPFGSTLVVMYNVTTNSSSVAIPSSDYWHVVIRRARFIDENYTVHVTGMTWQDGTEVPTTFTSTSASTSTTAPTEVPPSNPADLISLMIMIGGVIVVGILIDHLCLKRDWGSGTHHDMQHYSEDERLAIINVIDSTIGSQDRVSRYVLRNGIHDLISKGELDVPLTKVEDVIDNSVTSGLIVEHENRTVSLSVDYETKKKEILSSG